MITRFFLALRQLILSPGDHVLNRGSMFSIIKVQRKES